MSDETIKDATPPPEPPPPPEPVLVKPDVVSEHDVAALVGILIKTVQIDLRLAAQREKLAEINKEMAADSLLRAKGINALNLFGFDSSQNKVWTAVREVIGPEVYQRGLDIGNGKIDENAAPHAPKSPPEVVSLGETVTTYKLSQPVRSESNAQPKISDALLAFLRERGNTGVKASELRHHLQHDYGIETHEKTPGMTLYRLSKDGLVRREKRLWFATDPTKIRAEQEKTATSQ